MVVHQFWNGAVLRGEKNNLEYDFEELTEVVLLLVVKVVWI